MELLRTLARAKPLRMCRAKTSAAIASGNRLLSQPAMWAICCISVLLLQTMLVLTHEPWLDEYQAIQIAVQAPDLAALFDWLRYEGHPPLWYLILRGLSYLVEPLTALSIAGLAFALAAQAMILFASPFTRCERLLIASSEFILFDFLTLSRSMTMGVAIIIAALVLWRSRWVWLAIAILPMCDFLFGVISGIMVLLKIQERRVFIPGLILWLVVGAVSAWGVIPPEDMVPALGGEGPLTALREWTSSIGTLLIPFQGGWTPQWNAPIVPLASISWAVFLWFAWVQTRRDLFQRLLLFGFIGMTFVFSIVIYPLALRHLMLIALLLIAFAWLARADGGRPNAGFRLWLGVVAVCGMATAAINFVRPFDTAHLAAAEIERQGLTDKHWMGFPDSRAQGVSAILGMDFERVELSCMQSFIRWNHAASLDTPARIEAFLRSEVEQKGGSFYLLSDLNLSLLSSDLVQPLAAIQGGYYAQDFYLFQIAPDLQEADPELPPCTDERRPFSRLP